MQIIVLELNSPEKRSLFKNIAQTYYIQFTILETKFSKW